MARIPTGLALLLFVAPAFAQWGVVTDRGPPPVRAAAITNHDGYRIRIFRDPDNRVRMRFFLRRGFDRLGNCPTFQVAGKPPVHQSSDGSACSVGENWADFGLGRIAGGKLKSLTLHRLLNGDTVTFRYTLKGHGYGETRFTLTGSKQAVTQALGAGIEITPGESR